ncbi:MAG: hypothetical protein AB7N76_19630 [Planctomycetota bacterium]
MRRRAIKAMLLAGAACSLLVACAAGSAPLPPTTGGGGGRTGGSGIPQALPSPNRDPLGYRLDSVPLSSVPDGEVSALGIATAGTQSLAGLAPAQDVVRLDQARVSATETTLAARARSVATVGSLVFAATSEPGQPGAGDVYLRRETSPGTFTWSVALDTAADVAVVGSSGAGAVAAVGTSAGAPPRLHRYDAGSGTFAAGPSLGSVAPVALVEWPQASGDLYVGGTDGAAPRLIRVRGAATEVLAIPALSGGQAGVREEVTGFAWARNQVGSQVLLIATGSFDGLGRGVGGQLLVYDGALFLSLWSSTQEAATALAITPEQQVYLGTSAGQLLYFDGATMIPEPGFPAVSRVTSLLARDGGSLLVGCRTSGGALLVVRARKSP